MTDRKVSAAQSLSWILLIPVALLILYLVVDFGQQVVIYHQQRQELRRIDEQILLAQEKRAVLEADLLYALSDDAAEKWAREQGWAGPDEVLVVLVGPDMMSSDTQGRGVQPLAGPATPKEAWWDLFFAER
jgi:hypothetical protein